MRRALILDEVTIPLDGLTNQQVNWLRGVAVDLLHTKQEDTFYGLPTRARFILQNMEIRSWPQLARTPIAELIRWPNCGWVSLIDMQRGLMRQGLSFQPGPLLVHLYREAGRLKRDLPKPSRTA